MGLNVGDIVLVTIIEWKMFGWNVKIKNNAEYSGLLLPHNNKIKNGQRCKGIQLLAKILRVDRHFVDLSEIGNAKP